MILSATIRDDNGQAVGMVVLQPKTFASGAGGFFGQTKLTIDGQRYQVQAQLVAIRAKGGEPEQTPAA